jgi:glycosyltransferase involved in cell wall biosynthesis
MASCLPIVTTPVGAIPEVLQEGKNCLYVQPGDADALAEKILHLLEHPELGLKMGVENMQLVREAYDIKIIGSKLEEIYSRYMKK